MDYIEHDLGVPSGFPYLLDTSDQCLYFLLSNDVHSSIVFITVNQFSLSVHCNVTRELMTGNGDSVSDSAINVSAAYLFVSSTNPSSI